MPLSLDENILRQFFGQTNRLTVDAKFWTLPEAPIQPTFHIQGDVSLTINGKATRYPEGAFVFHRLDGSIGALPSSSQYGGGITVEGSAVRNTFVNPSTNYQIGNMPNLEYNERNSRLRLVTPEGQMGFAFRYPAPSPAELIALAEKHGAIMHVRDSSGKMIEGFFVDGKGGVAPNRIAAYHNAIDLKGGEFLSIHRGRAGDEARLFAYKVYTEADINQITQSGRYAQPGNNVTSLQTLNGEPLRAQTSPRLNIETGKTTTPWFYKAQQIDLPKLREEYIEATVRNAELQRQYSERWPDTYGKTEKVNEAQLREAAGKTFDERAALKNGPSMLFAETDELTRSNHRRMESLGDAKPAQSQVKESAEKKPVEPAPTTGENPKNRGSVTTEQMGTKPQGSKVESSPQTKANAEKASLERSGKGFGLLGLAVVGTGGLFSGAASLYRGESVGRAAMEAINTILPVIALSEGKYSEAAVQATETAAQFALPLPIVGEAFSKALTDLPRQILRANGYDVAPSTTEQYRERLRSEYSIAEIRSGLQNTESSIYKNARNSFSKEYDKLLEQGAAKERTFPSREAFIDNQIRQALRPLLSPSPTMAKVPSGITRLESDPTSDFSVKNGSDTRSNSLSNSVETHSAQKTESTKEVNISEYLLQRSTEENNKQIQNEVEPYPTKDSRA